MTLIIERSWSTDCVRCANEGTSYEPSLELARAFFLEDGWTEDGLCPSCNGGAP